MPYFQTTLSIAANATVENFLTGSSFERAPYNALCEFAVIGAATGLVYDIITGGDMVAESCGATIKTTPPQLQDDFLATDVVQEGQLIKVRVRNTTAGAISCTVAMRMQPAVMR